MKYFLFLASFCVLSSVSAHDFIRADYPKPASFEDYNYQVHDYELKTKNYDVPFVHNAQYGPSTIRKRIVPVQKYAHSPQPARVAAYNNPNAYYGRDFYSQNGSRYDRNIKNVVRGTTSYAYGQKLYQPTRPTYSRTHNCGY